MYAQWPQHATHPSNAPYTIHHAGGSATVYADQQTNGGQWNLLGTFLLESGQNHRVEVTDEGNGVVVADAIKFTPVTSSPNAATWTPTISTSDTYQVYTRWTSHANRATDATYTIHHQGGSTAVVVNQQTQGGQWVLLGTFSFDPASNHRIELSEEGNGTVVADAVYVVPTSATPNAVTWEPTLTVTDEVDVYAKWMEGGDRSSQVSYTVHHAGGSTISKVNQRANGGVWNHLGRYTMTPSINHRVEVTDSTDGVVAADAVRFVSVTTSGAGLMYVHADHLGTPQKMTNESQALVWDAVYEPFGNAYAITGSATNNQRFPGQYFDQESGFAYNYFRDYDSSTGRYVQSDPIGLGGGSNTYSYVGNNPLTRWDFLGLWFPSAHDYATRRAARAVGCDNIADKLGDLTAEVDYAPNSQDAENSYKHAMRDGLHDQSVAEAEAWYNWWITTQGASSNPADLADALHAIQDSYSPAHEGSQPWYGDATPYTDLFWHGLQELVGGFTPAFQDAVRASENFLEKVKTRHPCLCQKTATESGIQW